MSKAVLSARLPQPFIQDDGYGRREIQASGAFPRHGYGQGGVRMLFQHAFRQSPGFLAEDQIVPPAEFRLPVRPLRLGAQVPEARFRTGVLL